MKNLFDSIKLGFRLLKYGYKMKTNAVVALVMVAIGVIVELASNGTNIIGAVYLMLMGMVFYQLIISLTVSTFIQTSSYKKALQTSVPAVTWFCYNLVVYTFVLVEKMILSEMNPMHVYDYKMTFLWSSFYMVLTAAYSALAYKAFVLATVFLLVTVFGISFMAGISQFLIERGGFIVDVLNMEFWQLAIFGYLMLILGTVICLAISNLLYKRDLSKFAIKGFASKY